MTALSRDITTIFYTSVLIILQIRTTNHHLLIPICYLTEYCRILTVLYTGNILIPNYTRVVSKIITIKAIVTIGSSLSSTIWNCIWRTSIGFLISSWTIIKYFDIHTWRDWGFEAILWPLQSTPNAWAFISYWHIHIAIIIYPLYKRKSPINSYIVNIYILRISTLLCYESK